MPQRLGHAVEVTVCAGAALVGLASACLGKDARIAVAQHDYGSLDEAAGAGMPLLIQQEPVLQCLVRNLLHPGVHRGVNLDMSLQQIFFAKIGAAAFQFVKDIVNDCGRPDGLVLVLRDGLDRA